MNSIKTKEYTIEFSPEAYTVLNHFIHLYEPSKIVIVTDRNTKKYCLDRLLSFLHTKHIELLTIPDGEEHKNIRTCEKLWNELSKMRMDRKGLVINLGGGMVTDLGGFAASTFQ